MNSETREHPGEKISREDKKLVEHGERRIKTEKRLMISEILETCWFMDKNGRRFLFAGQMMAVKVIPYEKLQKIYLFYLLSYENLVN